MAPASDHCTERYADSPAIRGTLASAVQSPRVIAAPVRSVVLDDPQTNHLLLLGGIPHFHHRRPPRLLTHLEVSQLLVPARRRLVLAHPACRQVLLDAVDSSRGGGLADVRVCFRERRDGACGGVRGEDAKEAVEWVPAVREDGAAEWWECGEGVMDSVLRRGGGGSEGACGGGERGERACGDRGMGGQGDVRLRCARELSRLCAGCVQ